MVLFRAKTIIGSFHQATVQCTWTAFTQAILLIEYNYLPVLYVELSWDCVTPLY